MDVFWLIAKLTTMLVIADWVYLRGFKKESK
jgi:hypothetical protein